MNSTHESWKKFLHPETLKNNLITISLFITAFEMFKTQVIDKPRTFFTNGLDPTGPILSEKYKTEVLSKSKSPLYASLLFLVELNAIDQNDINTFNSIKAHRNELAHQPIEFISSSEKNFDVTKFQDLIALLTKIEKWWFINFELSIDPDMLPEGADANDVVPGPIWSLQLMLDVALGNEPEEGFYYKAFSQQKT